MIKSDNINELAAALSKTQAALTRARESATNPFLKNSYADLGDVWDAAREPMTAHGLSIAQFPTSEGDSIGLATILMHESGQWIEDTVYLPLSDERGKSQAQVAGSIISYLRRYGLSAVLGVVTGEDDDGNAGSDPRQPTQQKKTKQQPSQDTRGATSPQRQAKRQRPAAPKSKSNGKDTDWKAKALAAKSLATFASAAALGLDQYTSEQHVTNALESVEGFEYNAVKNETYWNWLKERKTEDAAA